METSVRNLPNMSLLITIDENAHILKDWKINKQIDWKFVYRKTIEGEWDGEAMKNTWGKTFKNFNCCKTTQVLKVVEGQYDWN